MSLSLAISAALREIQTELFRGPVPDLLHHYTSAIAVESIGQTRALWGTCLADQSDQTEVSHTAALVTQLAEELSNYTTDFPRARLTYRFRPKPLVRSEYEETEGEDFRTLGLDDYVWEIAAEGEGVDTMGR